jgi:hypothetical protein
MTQSKTKTENDERSRDQWWPRPRQSESRYLMANTKKLILGWNLAFAGVIALAPAAHAIGEHYYLDCLRQQGLNVNDEKQALDIGSAIEHNGVNGVDQASPSMI